MPGLIDAHWHSIFAALPLARAMTEDIGFIYLVGGVSSPRSPLDMATFTEPELRAAIETAQDWNTHCNGARVPAAHDPARDCRRGEVHRARSPHGRRDGGAHGNEGHMAQYSTVSHG
jgi:hypothetical protein